MSGNRYFLGTGRNGELGLYIRASVVSGVGIGTRSEKKGANPRTKEEEKKGANPRTKEEEKKGEYRRTNNPVLVYVFR